MSTITAPRPCVKSASAADSWTFEDDGLLLLIAGTPYRVEVYESGDDDLAWTLRLHKLDGDRAVYDLAHDQGSGVTSCNCGDYTFRKADTFGECKHSSACMGHGLLPEQRVVREVIERRARRAAEVVEGEGTVDSINTARPVIEQVLDAMPALPESITGLARSCSVSFRRAKRCIMTRFRGEVVCGFPLSTPAPSGNVARPGDNSEVEADDQDASLASAYDDDAEDVAEDVLAAAIPAGRYKLHELAEHAAGIFAGWLSPAGDLFADALLDLAHRIYQSGATSVHQYEELRRLDEAAYSEWIDAQAEARGWAGVEREAFARPTDGGTYSGHLPYISETGKHDGV